MSGLATSARHQVTPQALPELPELRRPGATLVARAAHDVKADQRSRSRLWGMIFKMTVFLTHLPCDLVHDGQ